MTPDEARRLRKGDKVLTDIRGRETVVVVASTLDGADWSVPNVLVYVRRPGLTSSGHLKHTLGRWASGVRPLPPEVADPLTPHIYADFLEENGHPEAAELLRRTFPLYPGATS